jgi:signal transduction histidine kinase
MWAVFLQSALVQSHLAWFDFLFFGRLSLMTLAALLAIHGLFRSGTFLTPYFMLCMAFQSVCSILEGPDRVDYYSYVPYFFLMLTLSFDRSGALWLKAYFAPVLILLFGPLAFKNADLYKSFGDFVNHFSSSVVMVFFSLIILRLNTSRYKTLVENLHLQTQIAEIERSKGQELTRMSEQVAHDIRSPLGALEMAFSSSGSNDRELNDIIRGAIARVRAIVSQLLEKNTGSSQIESVLVLDRLERLFQETKLQYRHRTDIDFDLEVDPHAVTTEIRIEGYQWDRALVNLLQNSVEAMHAGGRLLLELRRKSPSEIEIRIQDAGIGMDPSVLGQVFKRGFTHNKPGGSGLGLSFTEEVISKLGGKIEIVSHINIGTIVTLTMPCAEAGDWLAKPLMAKNVDQMIIIEDAASVRSSMQRLLDLRDDKFVEFDHPKKFELSCDEGQRCLDRVNQKRAHLLVDYDFNGERIGLEFISRLRLSKNGKKNTYLMTSRFFDPDLQRRSIEIGVHILPKSLVRHFFSI